MSTYFCTWSPGIVPDDPGLTVQPNATPVRSRGARCTPPADVRSIMREAVRGTMLYVHEERPPEHVNAGARMLEHVGSNVCLATLMTCRKQALVSRSTPDNLMQCTHSKPHRAHHAQELAPQRHQVSLRLDCHRQQLHSKCRGWRVALCSHRHWRLLHAQQSARPAGRCYFWTPLTCTALSELARQHDFWTLRRPCMAIRRSVGQCGRWMRH